MRKIPKEETERRYKLMESELNSLIEDESKIITYRNGRKILVDLDFSLTGVEFKMANGYTEIRIRKVVGGKRVRRTLSRVLLGVFDKNQYADHINRNTLDNRRRNLRLVTPSKNARNRSNHNPLIYKGVYKRPNANSYKLTLGKINEVGLYVNLNITSGYYAAIIYDCLSLVIHGDDMSINFDRNSYTNKFIDSVFNRFSSKIKQRAYSEI